MHSELQERDTTVIRLVRTHGENTEYLRLVAMLDEHLARVDGMDHATYADLNTVDSPRDVVLANTNGGVAGCGALRPIGQGTMEIKRMFVLPAWRRQGIAALILAELEDWARDQGAHRCVLETGSGQPDAIALYTCNGYERIQNFGPFVGIENSLCFEKMLR